MNDPKAFCGLNMPDYALILIIQKLKMEKNKLIFHFLKKWKMLFVKNKLIFIFQNRKKMNDPKTHGFMPFWAGFGSANYTRRPPREDPMHEKTPWARVVLIEPDLRLACRV
jgi:hypothetical protein